MGTSNQNLLFVALLLGANGIALADATSSDKSDDLQTIIVTAQRRAERLQDVPLSVTLVPAAQLDRQNITQTSDLVKAVPALNISNYGVMQLRGIGTQGFGISSEGDVSIVVDGVVLGRDGINNMFDIEQVEVLTGPQGTLFGKNASAGVINITTKAPQIGEYDFIGHVDAGNHDYVHSYVIGNLPLGSDAALRVAFHHDGYGDLVRNDYFDKWDNTHDDGARARLLWKPTDDLTINVIGDYESTAANGVNGVSWGFAGVGLFTRVNPGSALASTLANCGVVPSSTNNQSCANSTFFPGYGDRIYGDRAGGASVEMDYNLGGNFRLTSIAAYRERVEGVFGPDANIAGVSSDSLPTNILDRNLVPSSTHTITEETRIESPSDRPVTFQSGIYFSWLQSHNYTDQAGQLGIPLPSFLEVRRVDDVYNDIKSYAGFGQVNYKINPQFEVFAGVRDTYDVVKDLGVVTTPDAFDGVSGNYIYTPAFAFAPINQLVFSGNGSANEPARTTKNGVSWKVGSLFYPTPDTTLFATITRAYKGPYINDQASPPVVPSQLLVRPEYPTAYEIGVKQAVTRSIAFDMSVFYERIKDFQTTIFQPGAFVNNFIQGNAPYVTTKGVEATMFGRAFEHLSFNTGIIYNETNFSPNFVVACVDPTSYATGECDAGKQLPYAPRWKATLSGEYELPMSGRINGFVQSDFIYASTYPYLSDPLSTLYSPAKHQLGARIGIRASNNQWSAALFCRNCTDQRFPVTAAYDTFAPEDGGRVNGMRDPIEQYLSLDSFRLVGVTFDVKF